MNCIFIKLDSVVDDKVINNKNEMKINFEPPFCALVAYHQMRCGMPLHDLVGVNCEKRSTADYHGAGA